MPIKTLLYRFQPSQLYIVLVLSICYFVFQMVLSHLSHALTLLMASYHMLCNILALTGCIITIKHSKKQAELIENSCALTSGSDSKATIQVDGIDNDKVVVIKLEEQTLTKRKREMKLRNTFGWTRIDVLTMLMVCIILASLSFSLLVEALQTLIHIDHQDTMHWPGHIIILGCVGLILNGITYLLIGGYTMHQGSFLHITPSGEVVLDRAMSNSGDLKLKPDERQLSRTRNDKQQDAKLDMKQDAQQDAPLKAGICQLHYSMKRQGCVEMLRDVSSTIFVVVCALIVYVAEDEQHTAKFIDPILSIFSCVLLVSLSYPYMKESCLILLQTIPGSIDMQILERTLVKKFPQIVSYHDLHIWQLSAHKSIATVHIKFQTPPLYATVIGDVIAFFHQQGITEVTIQPEFHCSKVAPSLECLVQCSAPECVGKVCCRDSRSDLHEVSVCPTGGSGNSTNIHIHGSSKEKPQQAKRSKLMPALLKLGKSSIRPRSQSVNDLDCKGGSPTQTQSQAPIAALTKTESACQVTQPTNSIEVLATNEPEEMRHDDAPTNAQSRNAIGATNALTAEDKGLPTASTSQCMPAQC